MLLSLALCLQHSFRQPLTRVLALFFLVWAPFLTLMAHLALGKVNLAWPVALP